MLDALILTAALLTPPPLQCLDPLGRPSPDRPVRLDSTMKRPELIHSVPPVLGDRRPLGVILIEAIIDRHGRVCAARLQRGSEPLATVFLEAVKQWKFKPAMRNGKAVAVFYSLTVNFDGG